jgi:hypothetical protein
VKSNGGRSTKRTLIFGAGDTGDGGLGIAPMEPVTNLESILTDAGYGVDVSATLPAKLTQYKAIWFIDDNPLTTSEETKLEAFVNGGHGLYLTGEKPGSAALDDADGEVVNDLVEGGGIAVGGQGDADDSFESNGVNSSAIDEVALSPNKLTTWTPAGPGGMAGVAPSNILTSTSFSNQLTPTGAVWAGTSLTDNKGRLAVLMDINWLESEFWDAATAPQVAVNLERFLTSATPVAVSANSNWAGYASKAYEVKDVTGEWTVPTVDCSQATKASAVDIGVGIDGFGNQDLVKAGVGVTCDSPTATPCYYLLTEVRPGSEDPITPCSAVAPGDDISVDIENSPFGSSSYTVSITDNGTSEGEPIQLTAPSWKDASAECVVEQPEGRVGITPTRYKRLADFGTVTFTNCAATAAPNAGGSLDTDQLATGSDGAFKVTSLDLGTKVRSKATVGQPNWQDLTWSVSWVSAK